MKCILLNILPSLLLVFFMRACVLLLTQRRVAGVKCSSAFVCVCYFVCLFVCPHDRTKTAETTITKLATGIVHHECWLPV